MRLSPELAFLVRFLAREFDLSPPWDSARSRSAAIASLNADRLLALALEHQLAPLLFARWKSDAQEIPGGNPHRELEPAYFQSGRQAVLRQAVLVQALHLLQAVAEPIVLKGAAVTSILYREAAERPMRDIDFLFKSREEQHRAQEVLGAAGFSSALSYPEHHHLAPMHDPSGRISIELHDNLTTPPLPTAVLDALWERRVRGSKGFWILDPAGQFLHHAIHALKDPVDSPFLRDLFEAACLASRLSPEEQEEASALALRAGADSVVRRTLKIAHDLFGSPDFMAPPPRGPYEAWLERRLEWTAPVTRGDRWFRHLARERFNRLCECPDERSPWPWLRKCANGWMRRAAASFPRLGARRALCYQRPPHASIGIGPNTLIHDASTGEVHMLNETATPLWKAALTPQDSSQLLGSLKGSVSDSEARAAVRAMIQCKLLRPVDRGAEIRHET